MGKSLKGVSSIAVKNPVDKNHLILKHLSPIHPIWTKSHNYTCNTWRAITVVFLRDPRTDFITIFFRIKNNAYTPIFDLVGVSVGDFWIKDKSQNLGLNENRQRSKFSKNCVDHCIPAGSWYALKCSVNQKYSVNRQK